MTTVDGGTLAARTLHRLGVRHAFGIHGGHLDPLLVALAAHGVELVDTRHEAAAGHAADGYARATGGLGVAFATSGPGFTNVYTALANAHLDRIPVLVLTSSPPQRESELNVLQGGFDQLAAAAPVTRWAHRVTTTARIPDLVAMAVRKATCGVPGPVLLELPIDVLFRQVDEDVVRQPGPVAPERPGPSSRARDEALALLTAAERPVLVAGGGAASSPTARTALERLLSRAALPVVCTSWGFGVVDPDHPCYRGGPATLAALPFLAAEPDLVVLLGARRGLFLGGRSGSMIPDSARVITVDVDGTEPGRIGRTDLAVTSDVGELVGALADYEGPWPDWSVWVETTRAAIDAPALLFADAEPVTASGHIHPYVAAREIAAAVGPDPTMVYDGGEASGWINLFARARRPGNWFGIGYLGGLGVGPGMAIGAQVADRDGRVVLVTGDGALGFNVAELDTMVRHRLPIVTVVLDNQGWGMSLHGQQLVYGDDTRVAVDLPGIRYDRVAEAFGLHAELVTAPHEVGPAVRRALDADGPALVQVAVAPEIIHPVMDDLGKPVPEGHTRIPYYESIPPGER